MIVWRSLLVLMLCCWLPIPGALAAELSDRVAQFPQWSGMAAVETATGDLVYPDWLAGTWHVRSTLEEAIAPLAPQVVTPGFDGNRQALGESVSFKVKFGRNRTENAPVVADRAFNGQNIARAYLGAEALHSVKVDPRNPNRQITRLTNGQQVISTVTGRESELPSRDRFIATEVMRQVFRSASQIYINTVEITTAYRAINPQTIEATQFAAIYLAPEDPDYFKTVGHPAALYRYDLELVRVEAKPA